MFDPLVTNGSQRPAELSPVVLGEKVSAIMVTSTSGILSMIWKAVDRPMTPAPITPIFAEGIFC